MVTTVASGNPAASPPHHHHAVQFYVNEKELSSTVAGFLTEGLASSHPAVLIATDTHTQAILGEMNDRRVNVATARKIGDLIVLDAEQALGTFMVKGMPDSTLFRRVVGGVLGQARRGREHTPIRAYGEMVDVLWKEGNSDGAIRLEVLWNDLAAEYSFSLLCGYAMGHFYKETGKLQEIVNLHSDVVGGIGKVVARR